MNDAALVGIVKGHGDFPDQNGALAMQERPHARRLAERLALDVGHRQVRDAIDLADVMNAADMGMVECCRRARLREEPLPNVRVGILIELRDLQRDGAVKLGIVGEVNAAHAALAQELDEPVTAK